MIKPADIKDQSFKKGLFGFKTDDVKSFVEIVYRSYDELYKENAELSDNLEKVTNQLKESRLKIFDLENQVQQAENVSSDSGETANAKKKADQIIKEAEAAAAEIIAKAKAQSAKLENATAGVEETKKESKIQLKTEEVKTESEAKTEASASSKFFKKNQDEQPATSSGDDDEIFVGEIEDARKPERMMIGDGEEEEDMDFEFL